MRCQEGGGGGEDDPPLVPRLGTRTGSTLLFSTTMRFCDMKQKRNYSFLTSRSIAKTSYTIRSSGVLLQTGRVFFNDIHTQAKISCMIMLWIFARFMQETCVKSCMCVHDFGTFSCMNLMKESCVIMHGSCKRSCIFLHESCVIMHGSCKRSCMNYYASSYVPCIN